MLTFLLFPFISFVDLHRQFLLLDKTNHKQVNDYLTRKTTVALRCSSHKFNSRTGTSHKQSNDDEMYKRIVAFHKWFTKDQVQVKVQEQKFNSFTFDSVCRLFFFAYSCPMKNNKLFGGNWVFQYTYTNANKEEQIIRSIVDNEILIHHMTSASANVIKKNAGTTFISRNEVGIKHFHDSLFLSMSHLSCKGNIKEDIQMTYFRIPNMQYTEDMVLITLVLSSNWDLHLHSHCSQLYVGIQVFYKDDTSSLRVIGFNLDTQILSEEIAPFWIPKTLDLKVTNLRFQKETKEIEWLQGPSWFRHRENKHLTTNNCFYLIKQFPMCKVATFILDNQLFAMSPVDGIFYNQVGKILQVEKWPEMVTCFHVKSNSNVLVIISTVVSQKNTHHRHVWTRIYLWNYPKQKWNLTKLFHGYTQYFREFKSEIFCELSIKRCDLLVGLCHDLNNQALIEYFYYPFSN